MTEQLREGLWRFTAECLAWALLVGVFLGLYVQHFAAANSAVLPHLKLVGTGVVALWSLRLAVWLWLPGRLGGVVTATLLGLTFILLAAYYALVLTGLHSWGRVVSWRLISTYAAQWQGLSSSVGVAPALTAAIALSIIAAVCVAAYLLTRRDWLLGTAVHGSRPVNRALVVAGPLLLALGSYQFVAASAVDTQEPLSLTLHPELDNAKQQSHGARGTELQRAAAQADRDAYEPSPNPRQRNVVLVVGDALRADRLGVYGYGRQTTPFLQTLAGQGRLQKVARMSASCAESTCGLLAIARSKYVHELSENDFSLHEVLRRHGWAVHLVLGGDHTNFYGLRAAYGEADSYVDGSMTPGFYMNDDDLVLDQLTRLPTWDGRPQMFHLHLMSSHPLGVRHDAAARFLPALPYVAVGRSLSVGPLDARNKAANHYDNGVLQVDMVLQQALAVLERKGYLKDAVIVLTGDHGEMLGEHGEFGHSRGVHEPALQVPFVMLHFGNGPEQRLRESVVAAQVDVAPTILAELGMPQPRSWSGMPLQVPAPRNWIHFRQGQQVGLYDVSQANRVLKYVRHLGHGSETVFEVSADAGERDNLISTIPMAQRREWQSALLPAVAAVGD